VSTSRDAYAALSSSAVFASDIGRDSLPISCFIKGLTACTTLTLLLLVPTSYSFLLRLFFSLPICILPLYLHLFSKILNFSDVFMTVY
jgi:hypothetical protein